MLKKVFFSLYNFCRLVILPAIFLLTLGLQAVHAHGTEPYQHELRGKLKKGDTLIVKDEKFRNPAYNWSKIRHHSVQDYIKLDLLRDSVRLVGKPFTCELDLKVEYWSQPDQEDPVTIEHVPLKIKYDTATGAVYQSTDIYVFKNAHRIKITVNEITCKDLEEVPGCFILTGQIFIERQYDLEEGARIKPFLTMVQENKPAQKSGGFTTMALSSPVPTTGGNQMKLSWTHTVGAEEVDLEWTTISSSSTMGALVAQWEDGTAPVNAATLAGLFRNNATRITTEEQEYSISLVFSDDYLMFRMRTVTYTNGIRVEGAWSYMYRPTSGGGDQYAIIKLPAAWHEANLNWQYSGTYAEGGKKKEVVNYMDGTLRSRQSVTVSNNNISSVAGSQQVAVVQENVYDEFGRPFASLLPAPLYNEKDLKYYPGAFQNSASKAYDYLNVYGVISGAVAGCVNKPLPVNTGAGAGRYYSENNNFKGNPAEPYHDYIPDAQGFPLSVSRYTPDNTGRLTVQGGVGEVFQPDPAQSIQHTTQYFYSKPLQWELDRIFGSDVGSASHYLKSTVVDPNGQASVSYVNAITGKTIATALAGPQPASQEALTSLPGRIRTTQPLIQPEEFVFDATQLKMTGTTTYVTPIKDTVDLAYDIQRLIHKYQEGLTICSNCYYALTIRVFDNCNNEKFKTSSPVDIGSKTADCNLVTNAQGNTSVVLEPGEYHISYELALSADVINDYTDTYIAQNTNLRKQFDFIRAQLKNADFEGCFSECTTCLTSLGTIDTFMVRVKRKLAELGVETNNLPLDTLITTHYLLLLANCQAMQADCGEAPCMQYRQAMMEDLTPGGQYALFDINRYPLDGQGNIINTYFRTVFPVLPSTDPAYIANQFLDNAGNYISPNDATFTLQDLVLYWKESWASAFIYYHPEYCKLKFCEDNATSMAWDEKMKNRILSAADIPVILPGYQYQSSVPAWLLAADPFFSSSGAGYYSQMLSDLQNYSQVLGINHTTTGTVAKNVTQYIDYLLYCADPSGNTNSGSKLSDASVWNNCTPVAGCRVPDREWELYRDIYFELKEKYYKSSRAYYCENYCPVGQPVSVNVPGCPSSQRFTLTLDSAGHARITYEGTVLDRTVTVTLYYPPEYDAYTRQTLFAFTPGGTSSQAFIIDEQIDLRTVLVESVVCDNIVILPGICYNGTGGTLYLPSNTTQLGQNIFQTYSGVTRTNYHIVKGTADVPDTTDCSGETVTRTFYNCLYVYYPGNNIPMEFSNVWLVACSTGAEAFTANPPGESSMMSDGGASLLALNQQENPCDYISIYDFALTYYGDDTFHGYYKYYITGPVIPPGVTVNLIITNPFTNTEVINRFYDEYSVFPDYVMISYADANYDPGFYQFPDVNWSKDCNYTPPTPPCPDVFLYKTSRFPDYTTSVPDLSSLSAENPLKVKNQVRTSCEAQADTWMQQLKPYLDNNSVSSTLRDLLRARLVEVCIYGGDIDHIFGASTTAPGRVTSSGNTSFGEAMLSMSFVTSFTMDYNPWLIESPFPYKTQAQSTVLEITNTNADICAKLSAESALHQAQAPGISFFQYLHNKYGAAMTLTANELNVLLKGCNNCRYLLDKNLQLPVFLEPGAKGSVDGTTFLATVNALSNENWSGGLNTSHPNYKDIYTNYLNHAFGFTLTYNDYKSYEAKALTNVSTAGLLCNKPVYRPVPVDPYACVNSVLTMAVNNGKREYDVYIAEEKQAFRRNYVNTCAAARAAVKLTASQQYYHYTLYYYDQAGNLVRTVPPEGVTVLLEDWELQAVTDARGASQGACNYVGPLANTDKALALQNLSSTIENANRSVEMWIYNPSGSAGQVLAVTSDNKYLFNTCLYDRYLRIEVQTLTQPAPGVVNIVASNHLVVDMQPLQPLRTWTHIVLQGTQPVASQPFDVFVNGVQCAVVTDSPPGGCGWELSTTGTAVLYPENLLTLKQLRLYNRLLPPAEIAANAKEGCLNITGVAPAHWARFNTPTSSSETVLVPGTTVETQYSGFYPAHTIPTSYAYNSLNQVVQQVSPDGGLSKFWYDIVGRLFASQNAEQHTPVRGGSANRYSYTKYDDLGRIIEVGEKSGGTDLTSSLNVPYPSYMWTAFHLSGTNEQITKTWYDAMPVGVTGINSTLGQTNLRKRVAATAFYDNISTVDQVNYYSYDINGNVKTLWQQIKGLTTKNIQYQYDLVSGKVNFVAYQWTASDQFFYQYKYDAENRLVEAKTGVEAAIDWRGLGTIINGKVDAIYRYYLHGPLARMEIGDDKLQGVDYAYTLQGWLKGINGSTLDPANEIGKDGSNGVGKDVMAYGLGYYAGDYKPVNNGVALSWQYQPQSADVSGHSLYNGNIGNTTVALKNLNSDAPVGYTYRYDQLNRLTKQRQHTYTGTTNWGLATNAYQEDIAYDGNGNILNYVRNSTLNTAMDNLSYAYPRDGMNKLTSNRLRHVTDAVTTPGGSDIKSQSPDSYHYDNIGNIIQEDGVNSIKWTVYGKIKSIVTSTSSLQYAYDAGGNRVYKQETTGGVVRKTWYVRDAQGNVLGVYGNLNGDGNIYWREQHLYGSSRLGMWQPDMNVQGGISWPLWGSNLRRYELTNHLGNVMATIGDGAKDGAGYPVVLSSQDYYPFGMMQPGRSYDNVGSYRYGFNGKENDNEIKGEGNQQDYGMRVYDPRLGRFLSVDPITAQYPELTPYQFASNRPIDGVDQDGLEWELSTEASRQKQQAQFKIDNARLVHLRSIGTITAYKPNWVDKWRAWTESKSPTHNGVLISKFFFGIANDAKIVATSAVEGKNHARGLDNVIVSDYNERIGAGINTSMNVFLPIVGAEVNAAFKRPQGINGKNWGDMSMYLKNSAGEISMDIVVQGSRASGTAKATSDIDIAIKVGAEQFDDLIAKAFGSPNVNSAKWRTMQHAIKTGKITTGDAGLRGAKRYLEELLDIKVDLSIIKRGGAFDNGAQMPIKGAKSK